MSLVFTVLGKPQPQGSLKAFKRGKRIIVTSDNAKLKPWREQVAAAAFVAAVDQKFLRIPRPHPVAMRVVYYFEPPKRNRLKHKTTKPDLDKLLRATKDALTGVAYDDDSQVTRVYELSKQFGSPARTEIVVTHAEQRAV